MGRNPVETGNGLRQMKTFLSILICCGSVSSGFSGKPSGEWVAEALNVPYQNEARICHSYQGTDIPTNSLVVALDAFYWKSYETDCVKPVASVRDFYVKARGSRVVIATVPDRNAGGFYRFVCGAPTSVQGCRAPINAAIREGCKEDCLLLDADDLYRGREDEDIHLTPQIWEDVAREVKDRLYAIQ